MCWYYYKSWQWFEKRRLLILMITEEDEIAIGTNLGMYLCKEFLEKHGQKIWVESVLGKNCDFKFYDSFV